MRDATPLVSVIIPVYNGEKYILQAIESALAQTYTNKEIIVVNDGSTDRTAQLLESAAPNIFLVHQENLGLGAARNSGVRQAKGELLTFLDADDLWSEQKLVHQVAAQKSHPLDPLIFSQTKQFLCPTLSKEERAKISLSHEPMPGYIASCLLLSRARFTQIGSFFEKKEVGEFVDWYLRSCELNIPSICLKEVHLFRRVHTANMGRRRSGYSRTSYLHILKSSLDRRRNELALK